tara:strand:- start:6011 stop:7174 length:1164 start_codon:yes stop_codon:yes gene_type:complete
LDRVSRNELIKELQIDFMKKFQQNKFITSSAPGRINLIGEHTDYNKGYAMPFGINRWICTIISKRKDKKIKVHSHNFNQDVDVDLNFKLNFKEDWKKYIFGCIKFFTDDYPIETGLNILVGGNIPMGYGLSSSAALEISLLGSLFRIHDLDIEKSILKIAKKVENEVIQVNSGLLDQYASLYAKKNKILLINFDSKNHMQIDYNINEASIILCKSSSRRFLADSKYNERVKECSEALQKINSSLKNNNKINDIDLKDLDLLNENITLKKRLKHVLTENKRVKSMINALNSKNCDLIGKILNQSHESLSLDYESSTSEIDFIINKAKGLKGFYGGRIVGGGFGGCCLVLINDRYKKCFLSDLKKDYYDEYGENLRIQSFELSSGLFVD